MKPEFSQILIPPDSKCTCCCSDCGDKCDCPPDCCECNKTKSKNSNCHCKKCECKNCQCLASLGFAWRPRGPKNTNNSNVAQWVIISAILVTLVMAGYWTFTGVNELQDRIQGLEIRDRMHQLENIHHFEMRENEANGPHVFFEVSDDKIVVKFFFC